VPNIASEVVPPRQKLSRRPRSRSNAAIGEAREIRRDRQLPDRAGEQIRRAQRLDRGVAHQDAAGIGAEIDQREIGVAVGPM
jgi:hypothetical protein